MYLIIIISRSFDNGSLCVTKSCLTMLILFCLCFLFGSCFFFFGLLNQSQSVNYNRTHTKNRRISIFSLVSRIFERSKPIKSCGIFPMSLLIIFFSQFMLVIFIDLKKNKKTHIVHTKKRIVH